MHPNVPTKSGLMLGLGETIAEIEDVMRDLRAHDVDMLTLGQYLQPSKNHLPVARYVTPDERSEEHTSELQSLMRISYAVFCLKKQKKHEYRQYVTNEETA